MGSGKLYTTHSLISRYNTYNAGSYIDVCSHSFHYLISVAGLFMGKVQHCGGPLCNLCEHNLFQCHTNVHVDRLAPRYPAQLLAVKFDLRK